MEKIVCYFDGRTLLKFKLVSKTCNDIAKNALRYNKLWKKICHDEIPKKYLIDLLTKQFVKNIPFNLLSEMHYETIYKNWLQWQSPVFNVSRIGYHNFLGHDGVIKIICHKLDVMIVFSNFMYLFSLSKNQNTGTFALRNSNSENCKPNVLIVLNPRPETNQETGGDNVYINCRQKQPKHTQHNIC